MDQSKLIFCEIKPNQSTEPKKAEPVYRTKEKQNQSTEPGGKSIEKKWSTRSFRVFETNYEKKNRFVELLQSRTF